MNSTAQFAASPDIEPAASSRFPAAIQGYLAISLPAMVLFADLAIALARGWRMFSRLDTGVVWIAGAWVLATTALLALPAGRRWYGQCRAQLILMTGSLCFAGLLAELLIGQVLASVVEPFHCRRPGLQLVYRPQSGIMRDVGPEAHIHFNAQGVRGDDMPARAVAFRILCVGGSSTACTYLDDVKTWPHLLGQDLEAAEPGRHCWVGNIGLPSFRSVEHLHFIEGSPLVDEMDCLVVQAGLNDFMSCLAGARPVPLWTHSRVRKLVRSLVNQYVESNLQVEDTAGQVYVRRRELRSGAVASSSLPNLDDGLHEFADTIRAIIDTCRRRNVRVVFTTQPVLWKAGLDRQSESLLWFGQLRDGRYLAVDQLRAGMDRYNETLVKVCSEAGAELIDLSQLNGDPAMFYDDCHFTETGARAVAKIAALHFAEHPIKQDIAR